MKPPKDLKSKFEEMMAEKMKKEAEDAEQKLRDEEEQRKVVCVSLVQFGSVLPERKPEFHQYF